METRFLETFLEVVRQGSLADAARRLGVTPAAISQRMQALEAEIGVPLLVRAGRTVQPTDAGRAILERSNRILAEVRQLRGLARLDVPAGELRLGAVSTAMTGLLPPALRILRERLSGIEVFLLPGTSADLYQQLLDSRIDAAILVRPAFELSKSFEWRTLRREPLMLICPESAPGDDVIRLIESHPFIRYDSNNWGGRLVDSWLRDQELRPKEWLELDSLDAIAVMVSNGLGLSIVPRWARPWPEGLSVRMLPLPGTAPVREIGAVWARSSGAGRLVQALLGALEESEPAA
ncbi:LysR family transcriptional regulator [Methylobrevis albus]|uniref:LysR family transcriptional regulator n=1 Tax=Methylobrevis albus TaxID=2793297 RepID=A0A931I528_9HYPH|nr:LysR family transcriptional regulator [Methylobrevis albus]MBH0239599.1 LysR family transcriptional regulator [Methylobrevis albus]